MIADIEIIVLALSYLFTKVLQVLTKERDIYIYRASTPDRIYQVELYAHDEFESLDRLSAILDKFVNHEVSDTPDAQVSNALAKSSVTSVTSESIFDYHANRNRTIIHEHVVYLKTSMSFYLHSTVSDDNKHCCYFGRNCDEHTGVFGSWDSATGINIFENEYVI